MTMLQRFGLEELSVDERRQLIQELREGLPEEEWELSPEQWADLNQRLDEDDADPDSGFTLEEIKARFKAES